jgi:hypothetical protein
VHLYELEVWVEDRLYYTTFPTWLMQILCWVFLPSAILSLWLDIDSLLSFFGKRRDEEECLGKSGNSKGTNTKING